MEMDKNPLLSAIFGACLVFFSQLLFAENEWRIPDESTIPEGEEGEMIRYGKELILNTQRYIGPEAKDHAMRYAGNNLACKNCHLDAGTRKYGAPFIGTAAVFPQYRKREARIGTLADRLNGCMQRSHNGKPMPNDSREIQAMVAYVEWLGQYIPESQNTKGRGFPKIQIPNRKVDLANGEKVYKMHCQHCHGLNGEGVRQGLPGDGMGYIFPPLWGSDSYNEGAGMHRVLKAARFIKANMPFGVTYENPVLTDEEAYDVAGYINSFPRPEKANKEKDYPKLAEKPVDSPYPPYADDFPQEQHKYGPFPPIIQYYKQLKAQN